MYSETCLIRSPFGQVKMAGGCITGYYNCIVLCLELLHCNREVASLLRCQVSLYMYVFCSVCSLSSLREWLHPRIHSSSADLYLVTTKGQIISPTDVVEDICQAFFEHVNYMKHCVYYSYI